MSFIDMITALYFHHIKFDPKNTDWPERDRVVLSKAHCCEAIYAALVELGVYPKETLETYYCFGSPFQGHADRWCTPGIDYSGGSLGQGLSFAAGMAYSRKNEDGDKDPLRASSRDFYQRYVVRYRPHLSLLLHPGRRRMPGRQVWEAAMFAAKYKLDNLIAIVDYNKFSLDGPTNEIMPWSLSWTSGRPSAGGSRKSTAMICADCRCPGLDQPALR